MTKEQLINIFMEAKRNKCDICVELTIPGQNDTEFIVNKNKSIENKLKYYLETYEDELKHCRNNNIRIINTIDIDFYLGGEKKKKNKRMVFDK